MSDALFLETVRVFYQKLGRMRYISHLDMNRCIGRALKRSELPAWHTLGFNPHIYLTFALPLSLGCESECESFDFRLTEQCSMEMVAERLAQVFPKEIVVVRAAPALHKPEAIAWADYEIELEYGAETAKAGEKLGDFLALPALLVTKKGKAGAREVDVKPHLRLLELGENGAGNGLVLRLRCAAGNAFNLNPALLLEAFERQSGCVPFRLRLLRQAVLEEDGQPFA